MLGEDQVHLVDQIGPFERQVPVTIFKPAQVEVVVLGFAAAGLSVIRDEAVRAVPMIRLRLAVEDAEHADQVVQLVGDPVIRGTGTEQVSHDDASAELEGLICLVIPGQPPEALEHAAFEHIAPRTVELREGGFDVGGRQFGHVAFGDLVTPLFAGLGVHEGAQSGFRQQVIPAANIDEAHHGGLGFVALGIFSGDGGAATTAVALIEHETGKSEMRSLGERLGFAEQIEGGAHVFDDGDALIGEVHNADAFDEIGSVHVA